MKVLYLLLLPLAVAALAGCGSKKSPENAAPESDKVSLFKEGKGVWFSDETKRLFGLEIAEVTEKPMQRRTQKTAQVYRTSREGVPASAMLLLSAEEAKALKVGQPVTLKAGDLPEISGTLVRLDTQAQTVFGQVEALVEFADRQRRYPAGTFLMARIRLRSGSLPSISTCTTRRLPFFRCESTCPTVLSPSRSASSGPLGRIWRSRCATSPLGIVTATHHRI